MAREITGKETGQRIIKGDLEQIVTTEGRELLVRNKQLKNLIDSKFEEAAKTGVDPAFLDVDVTIRW